MPRCPRCCACHLHSALGLPAGRPWIYGPTRRWLRCTSPTMAQWEFPILEIPPSSIGNSPIGYNGACHICPRTYPLPGDGSPNSTTCLIPGPVRPTTPNGIRVRSAVFPQCTGQTHAHTHTDTQTADGWLTGMVCIYSPLMLYCSNAG